MVSAHALEGRLKNNGPEDALHDAFIAKPVSFSNLLEQIRALLKLEWTTDMPKSSPDSHLITLEDIDRLEIISMARIGNASGIRAHLDRLESETPGLQSGLRPLRNRLMEYDLPGLIKDLEAFADDVV
jgi:hypothetical protein